MRKTVLTLALAAGGILPFTGVAQALTDANTFGTTTGSSIAVTSDPTATCNLAHPMQASDAVCEQALTGTHVEKTSPLGPTHGTYTGTLKLNYGYAAASNTNCASVSGTLVLKIYNKNNQKIGKTTITLTPADPESGQGSKACSDGQTPSSSDVSSLYLLGTISGTVGTLPVCGTSESKGSSVRNRNASGELNAQGKTRDTSNTQANFMAGSACSSA